MRCVVCGRGPMDNPPTSVFRINPKGEAGIWACEQHKHGPIDAEVLDVVHAIESSEYKRTPVEGE